MCPAIPKLSRSLSIDPSKIEQLNRVFRRQGFSTLQSFAEEIKIHTDTIRKFRKGQPISRENFQTICEALDLNWRDWMLDNDAMREINNQESTFTADDIVGLVFQQIIDPKAEKLDEEFSKESIAKINTLSEQIWTKLQDRPWVKEIRLSIEQKREISQEQVNQLSAYLQEAMDEDVHFANDIQRLAKEINSDKCFEHSNMVQNVYGNAKGWQTKVEGGVAYIGEIHQHSHNNPENF